MNVTTLDMSNPVRSALPRPAGKDAPSFDAVLAGVHDPNARAFLDVNGPPAREIARHLVSTAFILPALESMRSGAFHGERFAPGTVEKRFGPLLDRQIADRLASAPGFPLVDAVERHVEALATRRSRA